MLEIKKTLRFAGLLLLSLAASSGVKAQDIFQTAESTRSYNYVQAVYVFQQDSIDYPFIFDARLSVHPNFALSGEYRNLVRKVEEQDADGNITNIRGNVEEFKLGISGHLPSERWTRIDWIASAFYRVSQRTITRTGFQENFSTVTSAVLEAGLRGTVTSNFEVQGILSLGSNEDGRFVAEDTQLNLTAVFRLTNQFDVAVGVIDATAPPLYNLGVRYSW